MKAISQEQLNHLKQAVLLRDMDWIQNIVHQMEMVMGESPS